MPRAGAFRLVEGEGKLTVLGAHCTKRANYASRRRSVNSARFGRAIEAETRRRDAFTRAKPGFFHFPFSMRVQSFYPQLLYAGETLKLTEEKGRKSLVYIEEAWR